MRGAGRRARDAMDEQPLETQEFHALSIERRGAVLVVTIDHPDSELNAVDEVLHEELTALFRALRRESQARAVHSDRRLRRLLSNGNVAAANKHREVRIRNIGGGEPAEEMRLRGCIRNVIAHEKSTASTGRWER